VIPNLTALLTANGAVHAICGDNVFRTFKDKAGDVGPFIVWQIISGVPENNLSDLPEFDDARIQVDAYALSQATARQLSAAAQAVLEQLGYVVLGPTEDHEDETLLWRWSFDWEVWSAR
jgi:hypothetical protein